jgi:hypothetical protein
MRPFLIALLLGWAALCAFLVTGFPVGMDLAAHGAQMQTMVELLRGNADVARYYELHFPIGYAFPFWLMLPVTWLTNGAVAVKVALWLTLMLFPLSHLALLRAFHRSPWAVLWGLPFAFNISYWFGLLSGLFAQSFAFFALAAPNPRPRHRWTAPPSASPGERGAGSSSPTSPPP